MEDRLIEFVIVTALLGWIVGFGLAAGSAAMRNDRAWLVWFAFGAILGPLALTLLRAAPPGRCRTCGTRTRGWLRFCLWCGADVTAMSATVLAMTTRLAGPANPVVPSVNEKKSNDPPVPFRLSPAEIGPSEKNDDRSPTLSKPTSRLETSWPSTTGQDAVASGNGSTSPTGFPPILASGSLSVEQGTLGTNQLATAVYVTGTMRLESGRRYGIAVQGSRLRILGPIDIDPTVVVMDRPVAGIDASVVEGRLILTEPGARSGLVLAFMSVAGSATRQLADQISAAARV